MGRRVLLLEVGPSSLPATTPVTPGYAAWMPSTWQGPPPSTPANLAVLELVSAVRASWDAVSEPNVRYELERAPDVAGSPGTAVSVYRGTDRIYNSPETARTHWRVRSQVRGKNSAWSGWVAKTPIAPSALLAGNGVNLMLEEYSRFGATVPALAGVACTVVSSSEAFGGFYLRYTTTSTTNSVNTYFASTAADTHMPVQAGKYILSFYAKSSADGHEVLPSLVFDGGSSEAFPAQYPPNSIPLTTLRQRYALEITVPAGVSLASMRMRWNRSGVSGRTIDVDGVMLEPMIGTQLVASPFSPGTSSRVSYSALLAAAAAQDTADGKIDTFFQTSPPAGGTLGDLWFDTDDGNKQYRHNGTTWTLAQDTAIGDAILAAAGAQATADGKIRTYYATTAPTATALGDLWVNTTNKVLSRWSGSSWVPVADITADKLAGNGVNKMWDEYSRFNNAATFPTLTKSGSITTLAYDATVDCGSSGGGSLRAVVNDPAGVTSNSWVYFGANSVDYRLPLEPGKKYILSAYFKTNQAAGITVLMRFKDSSGAFRGNATVAVPGGTALVRRSIVVDMTAATTYGGIPLFYLNQQGATNAYTVWLDRIMVEEVVGNDETPSGFVPGPSGLATERAIANAATAQATADGKIDSFYQPSPPAGASEGDIWFDTDDSNKIYTYRSGSWVATPDSRIAQAIDAAAGAQATADGKVKTFYQTTAPTASGVGDLWYNKQTMILSRWNGSAWISNGSNDPTGGTGENLLPNARFLVNTAGAVDGGVADLNDPVGDGWYAKSVFASRADTDVRWYADGRIRLRVYGTVAINAGASVNPTAATLRKIPVEAGRKYRGSFTQNGGSFNGTAAPSVSYLTRMTVRWYDASGAQLSYQLVCSQNARQSGESSAVGDVTAPANAVNCEIGIEGYISNGSGSAWTHDSTVALNQYITRAGFQKIADLDTEVQDGTNYGRLSNNDLFSSGGVNRLGLRIGGSGQRIGSQRNLVRSGTSAYGMVRTTTALSATSTGAVTVNAHTVRYGGHSCTYNAVSNAVTGLTQGTTYVIYCVDADLSGGTKTYLAGTNPEQVMNISDDIYVVGQITIPTSGSSSGGNGGGGTNPGDWCVAADSFLPDGTFAGELPEGWLLPCYNNRPEAPDIVHLRVQANRCADAECLRLVTATGASIIASTTTPMTLRDGSCVLLPEMLGLEALVYRLDGSFRWESVTALEPAGIRRVAKISVSDQCYFAGERQGAYIATHNVQQMKP